MQSKAQICFDLRRPPWELPQSRPDRTCSLAHQVYLRFPWLVLRPSNHEGSNIMQLSAYLFFKKAAAEEAFKYYGETLRLKQN